MVKNRYTIFGLEEACGSGLVVGHFLSGAWVQAEGGSPLSGSDGPSIHYVGTSGWENQSSGCVLLHGGSGDWRHFGANLPRLAAETAVVALDLPGFGRSSDAEGPDLAGIADPVARLLQSLPWRDITLIGFSFGALVATEAALTCPPARMMLVSPAGFGAHAPEMAAARDLAARTARESGVLAGLEVNLRRIMLHRPDCGDDARLLALMEEMLRATRAKVRRFSRSELILDRLRRIECPVRVLFGAHDPYHASALQQRHRDIAVACLQARIETVPDAAHWLMLEQPEVFEAAVLEFCREGRE